MSATFPPRAAGAPLFGALGALALGLAPACSPAQSAGADAAPHASTAPLVYVVNLKDGDVVDSPVRVVFGLSGLGVAPAGIDREGTGHHHLLLDADGYTPGEPLPNNANYIHFGTGQTETVLDLGSGEHTLQLVFADSGHVPFEPSVESRPITIFVR